MSLKDFLALVDLYGGTVLILALTVFTLWIMYRIGRWFWQNRKAIKNSVAVLDAIAMLPETNVKHASALLEMDKKVEAIGRQLQEAVHELKPNSGSSMHDKTTRIEAKVDAQGRQVEQLAQIMLVHLGMEDAQHALPEQADDGHHYGSDSDGRHRAAGSSN